MTKKKIVIIGATSKIAEYCARLWVKDRMVDLTLVARDKIKTEKITADLLVRSPQSTIRALTTDFSNPNSIQSLADTIVHDGRVDIVLIAHGFLPNQIECQNNLTLNQDALSINGTSPVLFAEAFAQHFEKANHGTIGIIGSVAGDRGRKSNYVYGAAKGLVARYAQGLQHRLSSTNVNVVLIKPGPTDTPMTAELKQEGGKLASVESVATAIVKGTAQGKPVIYAPAKWAVIMAVICFLPRFLFNKLNI